MEELVELDKEVEVWEKGEEVEMYADWLLYIKYLKKQDEVRRCRVELKGV